MPRPLTTAALLLATLAACAVAAEDPTTCYQDGRIDSAATTQWQAALAGQDAALMAQLAGNWANEMTADLDGVATAANLLKVFAPDGQMLTTTELCPLGGDAACDTKNSSGAWRASGTPDGVITIATREADGSRPGFCLFTEVRLQGDNQLTFASTGGNYLTRG